MSSSYTLVCLCYHIQTWGWGPVDIFTLSFAISLSPSTPTSFYIPFVIYVDVYGLIAILIHLSHPSHSPIERTVNVAKAHQMTRAQLWRMLKDTGIATPSLPLVRIDELLAIRHENK